MNEPEQPTTDGLGSPAPQPDAIAQPPLPAAQAHSPGPPGKPRGIAFVIILSIITLGIYHLYWTYVSFDELKRHTGDGIGGILALLIAIVFAPINWFVLPAEVGSMYRRDGSQAPMTGWTGLWMFLPLVGWFVWVVKIQGALNRYWEGKAAPA